MAAVKNYNKTIKEYAKEIGADTKNRGEWIDFSICPNCEADKFQCGFNKYTGAFNCFHCGTAHISKFKELPKESTIFASYEYRTNGRLIAIKHRFYKPDGTKSQFMDKNYNTSPKIFYNQDALNGHKEAFLVEGEKDVETLKQHGYLAITKPFGAIQKWQGWMTETLNEVDKVIGCYDNDDSGRKGTIIAAEALGEKFWTIKWDEDTPEKYDITDLIKDKGIKAFNQLIRNIERVNINADRTWYKLQDFNFRVPDDYSITEDGISKVTYSAKGEPKWEYITSHPIIITGQAINTDEKTIKLELAFKRNNIWEKIQVDRETISDARKIITLSCHGIPVHSANSKKLVEYLYAFETANLSHLNTVHITHTNGWKNFNNRQIFGFGKNIIGLEKGSEKISFLPEPGFERFVKALHRAGTIEKWKSIIKPALSLHKVAFALYASFAPPLLAIVDAPSFIIHYWGESSMGKTTALEVAASIWGNPTKETGGLVTSWNNTQVFIERIATFFNDLPLCLDDSQTTDDRVLSRVLYMVANSTGRGRGSKISGVQDLAYWHTICFSTGERQLTESTKYDGARARTIELAGSPFGRKQAGIVNKVKSGVRENYGHVGMEFIKVIFSLLDRPEGRQEIKETYRQYRDILSKQTDSEIGDRLAHYFAVVWLAAEFAEDYLKLGGNPKEVIQKTFDETIKEQCQAGDMATKALQEVVSFAQANINSFHGKGNNRGQEFYGIWRDAEYIAFYPHKLREFLGKSGFSYTSVLQSWTDRKWIRKSEKNFTHPVKYDGNVQRAILLEWQCIAQVLYSD